MQESPVATDAIERETRAMAIAGVAARVVNAGLAFLTQVLFARLMGPAEYGVSATAMTLMLLVAGVATLGLTPMAQRFWPEYEAAGDAARLRGLLRFSLWAPLALGAAFAAAGSLLVSLLGPLLSPAVAAATCLALLAVPAQVSLDVLEGVALAKGWKLLSYGFAFVLRPLLVPLIFLLAWFAGAKADAGLAALASAAATGLAALLLLMLVGPKAAGIVGRGPVVEERRRWLRAGLPVMLMEAAFLLTTSADIVLLAIFHDDATVGAYGAASRLVALVAFVHAGLTWASAHHFSALHAAGEDGRLADYAARAARWTFWPSLGLAIIVSLAAPLLLKLFGKGFEGGAAITGLLLLGLLARAAAGPAEQLLVMTDNQDSCAYAYGWAFVVNVGLGIVIVPQHGALGAAACTAFAYFAASLIVAREVHDRLGFHVHLASLALAPRRNALHA
jgi:O-antigen/teichoic acid export membrane protein